MNNSDHIIRLSNGTISNRGRVQNREMAWSAFVDRMSRPAVDEGISTAQYEAFSKKAKGDTKAAAGFFFAGHCKDGIRQDSNVQFRSMINLDADELKDDEIYTQLKMGAFEDFEFEAFAHTTRSHSPSAPRLRIMIPLSREITDAEEYNAVARLVAERLDQTMEMFDSCSFRFAQMMYLPSCSSDQEYITKRLPGSICDPDMVLEECDGDWRDIAELPRAESEKVKIRKLVNALSTGSKSGMLSDPAKKENIIGAFCRAYPIETAMATFLPGVYVLSEGRGASADRYTFAAGSGVNGAVILNGTHLYSHHSTDPLKEQALNSFDLVRAYRFGHLDDPEFGYSSPAELESYRAMTEFAHGDDRVKSELAAARLPADAFEI